MTVPRIPTPEERTILTRRPCKHCKNEIYLQHIRVTSKMQWVCFDLDGKLHSCPNKPLAIETRQLIKEAIERMIPDNILTNTNNIEVLRRIHRMVQDLEFIRQYLANQSPTNQ
ncbi:MAG: hypothetical protein ACRD8W_17565 [Nitrososphaeraceae archaeon]